MKRGRVRSVGRRRAGITPRQRETLDRLARWIVMTRAGATLFTDDEKHKGRESWFGVCQRCGAIDWLQWCHVFTRGTWSVRWNEDNAYAWCRGCHRWLDQHWESKRAWVIAKIGVERYNRIEIRARVKQREKIDGTGLIIELASRLKAMGVEVA